MKNITVTVDDDTYRRARVRAAEEDTSVSALVKDFLVRLSQSATDFDRQVELERRTITAIHAKQRFSAAGHLGRDAVHQRDAVS